MPSTMPGSVVLMIASASMRMVPPSPLTPSLSPPRGEGARRAGEGLRNFAKPKSRIFSRLSLVTKMFSGFRSR